jgi:16S rRNA (adenine1518-N6/adenine1519-N6)-dimethyltransferase
VNAIDVHGSSPVVEIGPGEGVLTKYLVSKGGPLILVELDPQCVAVLRSQYSTQVAEILHADILTIDLHLLAERYGRLRIVGNIPYNITTPILFHVLDNRSVVSDAVFLMQREVAHRLAAKPGSKEYGILSVFWQLWATVEVLFDVSPGVIYPPPTVRSSLVRLVIRETAAYPVADEAFFRRMIRNIFGTRRKTLRNSLRHFVGDGTSLPAGYDLGQRPEDLSVHDLVGLANAVFSMTGSTVVRGAGA